MPRLITFGGLSVENGTTINGAANPRSRLAILAVLATAGDRGIRREKLAALFWPESDEERARNALRQALFTLKRDIGAGDITLGATDLRLNPDVLTADVSEFDAAMQAGRVEDAAMLYRGAFLDGVHLRELQEFERWAEDQRNRLVAEYGRALEKAATAASDQSDSPAAARWWERLAVHDPLSGRVARAYMEALAEAGERERAIGHAERHARLVRQELETEPDPEVQKLAARLREGGEPVEISSAVAGTGAMPNAVSDGDASVRESAPERPLTEPAIEGPTIMSGPPWSTPRRVNAKRGVVAVALVVTFAVSVMAWRLAHDQSILRGVAVVSDGGFAGINETDAMHELLRARLASGVAETQILALVPVSEHVHRVVRKTGSATSRRLMENPRFVITATIARDGDSLLVGASVFDAEAGQDLPPIDPLRVSRSEFQSAVEVLRSRVKASLASRADPLFLKWGNAAALPTNWESLHQLRLGIEAHRNGQDHMALAYLHASAALDSSSATPLVLAANLADSATALTITSDLARSSRRSGAWDQAMLNYIRVAHAGDPYATHTAAHGVLATTPGSEFVGLVAVTAMRIGRAREVVRLLRGVEAQGVLSNDEVVLWVALESAHHFLGEFRAELAVANALLQRNPNDRIFMQGQVKALSGLGRSREAAEVCKRSRRYTARQGWEWQPCSQAVLELRAHGYPAEARRLAADLLRESGAVAERAALATDSVAWLSDAGDFETLGRVLDAARADSAERRVEWVIERSLHAAWRGDRAALADIMRWRDSLRLQLVPRGEESVLRAQQAALLGDKAAAAAWVARALREGFAWRQVLHMLPGLDLLRGYVPFEAHLLPINDPEIQTTRGASPGA